MSNLCKTTYIFEERLSFLDICKIVAHFGSDNYEPSYFSFHSEVIKRDGYDNNFNLTLKDKKDKNENKKIEINSSSISFYGNDAKGSIANYEEVIDVLSR